MRIRRLHCAAASTATRNGMLRSVAARPEERNGGLRSERPPGPPRPAEPRRRLRLATVLALVMFAAIGVRLVQIQLTDASAYAAEGLKDRLVRAVLPASRGAILDRNGKILVHSIETRYVA